MIDSITTQQQADLESMIDSTTLAIVLDALAAICDEKADHLNTNWQDPTAARHWSDMAGRIATAANAARNKFGR